MIGRSEAIATVAVRDLAAARRFYEGTLGLTLADAENSEVLVFKSGISKLFVYRSRYAGTNKATAVTWAVGDDLEEIAHALKSHGIKFERYDMPQVLHVGDIHIMGDVKVVWFKDPDGNILSIVN